MKKDYITPKTGIQKYVPKCTFLELSTTETPADDSDQLTNEHNGFEYEENEGVFDNSPLW